MHHLQSELSESSFCRVPEFDINGASDVVDIWLGERGRQLTAHQKEKLLEAFQKCPLPLFLKMSAEKAFQWTSFEDKANIVFETSVKEAIHALFASLEKKHGRLFVSHTLGYITAGTCIYCFPGKETWEVIC